MKPPFSFYLEVKILLKLYNFYNNIIHLLFIKEKEKKKTKGAFSQPNPFQNVLNITRFDPLRNKPNPPN